MYLLSLPSGARASIRSLAQLRDEGRTKIAKALHDLERCGYLRRVTVKDPTSGWFSTEYEIYDVPYDQDVSPEPEFVNEGGSDRASRGTDAPATGPLPRGAKTGGKVPPTLPAADASHALNAPHAPHAPHAPEGPDVPDALRSATKLLLSLRRVDARLRLGVTEALSLAPLVEDWRAAGAGDWEVRAALTGGLPTPVHSAPALIADRLRRKMPTREPELPSSPNPECVECGLPVPAEGDRCHVCAAPEPPQSGDPRLRTAGVSGFIAAAARRGGALARAACAT